MNPARKPWLARWGASLIGLAAVVLLGSAYAMDVLGDGLPDGVLQRRVPANAIPIAVLGDSGSHSFQDSISFPPGSPDRGGPLRARTFQWIEVLARLRGNELDPGPFVAWGSSGVLASGREAIGLSGGRAPKKEDYLYNFANSGAGCNNLLNGRNRQAPRLVALMDREPERWKRGVVFISIGLNNWAGLLDLQAREPDTAETREAIRYCTEQLRATVNLIHASHPETRVLLAGIVNDADDPGKASRWQSAGETANINKALGNFNAAVRKLAESLPRTAFYDDAAVFARLWGGRNPANGKPDYKTVTIGKDFRVTNSAGDDPRNALVADGHAGVVWNTFIAQAVVARLREAFQLPLTPITDKDVADFVLPLARLQPGK
ncbi:MAG: SGNH/GDSL hydrolase family protein [Variovorax sp.]|nr:MAG: SGNH/GDSL hydrolase family protein [Variovorax sp.]